jgi:alpha-amylase/alpha-mannosidase (GH57 family)
MPPPAVKVALLWHMHQPYYLDPETGESVLPWVRLHALKDYWGMVDLVGRMPGMRCTFNLVPSLVEQVEAYAHERTWDRLLVVGMHPADRLERADAEWLVREGFHAHPPTMIEPYGRYAELWRRQASRLPFDAPALRDLQVWQKLAWVDPDVASTDERVRRLVGKGRGFDESDKAVLRAVELEVLRRVVPAYRAAAERGHVELSCSPYYHPILPLLCDSGAHHDAHPGAPLPHPPFRWPEDAEAQLTKAVEAHTAWFGVAPRGVWPSEGSVSTSTADVVARSGLRWMATDEDILRRSRALAGLDTSDMLKFRAHEFRAAAAPVRLLFRDHGLSDAIGFSYQRWATDAAVADFLAKLRHIGRSAAEAGAPVPTVSVILDGENAWEHYPGGGRPFLARLYAAMAEASDIAPVTASEAAADGCAVPLPRLFAGSWIHGDFGIWIGHADDRRAWTQLGQARTAFEQRRALLDPAMAGDAFQALQAAEGSDWFWWYGDDHSSAHDREFDALFRRHLRRAWSAMGQSPPEELHRTNITTPVAGDDILRPSWTHDRPGRGFLRRLGLVPLERPSGTMHRGGGAVVDACELGVTPSQLVVSVELPAGSEAAVEAIGPESGTTAARPPVRRSVEGGVAVIPWSDLEAGPGDVIRARVLVRDRFGALVGAVPADGMGRQVLVPAVQAEPWTA